MPPSTALQWEWRPDFQSETLDQICPPVSLHFSICCVSEMPNSCIWKETPGIFLFLLLWSTIKGARLNLEDAENQLEATASVGGSGSDAFAPEVHSKLGKMKRSLADIKAQQGELGQKQDNLSSAVEEARDLIRSMKDDLESLNKRAKPAPDTAPASAWLWPGVQRRMAQSMELALAQNTQNAQNAMQ